MKPIEFKNAYYIKLGRKGEWEASSIDHGKVRIGWKAISLDDIHSENWPKIRKDLEEIIEDKGSATRDYRALRYIAESTPADVWITFHASKLWWCQVGKTGVFEDNVSKYRRTSKKWYSCDIHNQPLIINQIPGTLSRLQGFRGTVCKVKAIDDLRRLLNDLPSEAFQAITNAKGGLETEIARGIKLLHWKDFETLVDLIFREAGWRRVSLLGGVMKYSDLELEEPVTQDRYQVQVKSSATAKDFEGYSNDFAGSNFRKLYFVVHSPTGNWSNYQAPENVELILPNRLAQMVVESGLTSWLLKKIR